MIKEHRVGRFLFWYDRSLRLWVVTERDDHDNQIGEAIYVASKDEARNLAHQMFNKSQGIKVLSDMLMEPFR